MKKIVSTMILSSLLYIGTITRANDCNLIKGSAGNNFGQITTTGTWIYKDILPVEGLKQALINLKGYCCRAVIKNNETCIQDKNILPTYFPESAFLFDHLVDITLRRLDGIPGLAYDLPIDKTGEVWRKAIDSLAKTINGIPPNAIENEYKTYRTLHKEQRDEKTFLNNYNDATKVSLADKYNRVCYFMKKIYEQNKDNNLTIIGSSTEKNSFYRKCEDLITQRVTREQAYVKLLMIKKANQLLDETSKAYTQKHFVEEKLMTLWNLVNKVKDTFQTIVQQAATAKTCSK